MNAEEILAKIRSEYQHLLGENLVGIYVHGSLAFGCFHPQHSDIDFIVIVRQPLETEVKKALITTLLALEPQLPAKGAEMSVVLESYARHFVHPCPFELHYSRAHTAWAQRNLDDYCCQMKGNDPDLAAHFTVILNVGRVLCGKSVQEVFGEVPSADYLSSLLYDAADALEGIHHQPVYFILNLCRTVAYLAEGQVLSKKMGGEWGMEHLPKSFHSLIEQALAVYAGVRKEGFEAQNLEAFVRYMLAQIDIDGKKEPQSLQ